MTYGRYDVAVLGLGVAGAMAAWQAAQAGGRVIAFDRAGPAHTGGSSHGGTRMFRSIGTEGPAYVPLARLSQELFRELGTAVAQPLLTTCGGLFIADSATIDKVARTAGRAGLAYERLDGDDLAGRYPQHRLLSDDAALFDPAAGVVQAEGTVHAAVTAARAAGADVQPGVACRNLRVDDAEVILETDAGTVRAGRVIAATGAWWDELIAPLRLPVRVERSTAVWFGLAAGGVAYRPDRFPVFVRSSGHLRGWGIPDVDGAGVKIGVSGNIRRHLRHPDENLRIGIGPSDVEPAEAYVAAALRGVGPLSSAARPSLTARTPDGHFIVGVCAGLPRVVLCGGLGGHGFKFAPALGRAVAQLALDGGTDVPLHPFHPDRFTTASLDTVRSST